MHEALRIAIAAAEAAPEDARTRGALGTVYVKMKDGAATLIAFEQMAACLAPETERLPSSPWLSYLTGRGVALSLLSRHDEAMEAFDEVLRTDPEFFDRWPEVAPHYQLSSRETERNTQGGS
jgi:tetratricopeptide (TPR) repeat protein